MIGALFVSLVVTFLFVRRFNLSERGWLGLLLIVAAAEVISALLKYNADREKRGWRNT